ncbi:MAG: RluA family pseudouridine synthase [Aureliella sp.]
MADVWRMRESDLLHEDNHLLVVNKPSGIATMGTAEGEPSVARAAAEFLKEKYSKPGNAFVGIVSRIDRLVSGVLVLAKTSKAASRLSDQIRRQATTKRYLAWVEGDAMHMRKSSESVIVEDYVRKNEPKQRMEVARGADGAQLARMRVYAHQRVGGRTLVETELITGRKHQIRLQLASAGHPIVGDTKYGSNQKFRSPAALPAIALHCKMTQIEHPTTREALSFEVSPKGLWQSLGGPAADALDAAFGVQPF